MPTIDPTTLDGTDRYRLLIGAVVPRPIAWISTIDNSGTVNLAPFSFFNGVDSDPMVVSVAIAARTPEKDTLRNLKANGEAVIHLVPPALLDACHQSGATYGPGVSEAYELNLALTPSQRVRPPRLTAADIALESRLMQIVPVGPDPTSLCLLEVLLVHVTEGAAGNDGLPDPLRLRAAARLGERCYLEGDGWRVVSRPAQTVPPGKGIIG